jgi:hypothetical protein
MNPPDDWLWDGAGDPDPRDKIIADKLARLAWRPVARHVPANGPWFRGLGTVLALAAALLLVVSGRATAPARPLRCPRRPSGGAARDATVRCSAWASG